MSWYHTNINAPLALEYSTLLAHEVYEPAPLARSLGRFRGDPQLSDLAKVLKRVGYIEYGADGWLYLNTPMNPLQYLEDDTKLEITSIEKPPIVSAFWSAFDKAVDSEEIKGQVSGLLREQIIEDAFKIVGEDDEPFLIVFSPKDFLVALAELGDEIVYSSAYPLLKRGMVGTFRGAHILLTSRASWHQILVIGRNNTVAVINAD